MKKLLFLLFCISHCLVAMDLDPYLQDQPLLMDVGLFFKFEKILSKKIEQESKEWSQLKSAKQLHDLTGKDVVPPAVLQKQIAFHMIAQVVTVLKNKNRIIADDIKLEDGFDQKIWLSPNGDKFITNSSLLNLPARYILYGPNKQKVVRVTHELIGKKTTVWDAKQCIYTLNYSIRYLKPKCFSSDGNVFASVLKGDDNRNWNCIGFRTAFWAMVFDIKNKKRVRIKLPLARKYMRDDFSLALNSDGSQVAVFFQYDRNEYYLTIADTYTRKFIYDFKYQQKAYHIAFSPCDNKVAIFFRNGCVQVVHVGEESQALRWLTNKLSNQKTFLLPDQAEIICKMYEAHEKGEQLAVTMNNAVRFSKMPDYVKKLLYAYFGKLKQAKVNNSMSCAIS